MPRSGPSRADAQLLANAAGRGYRVSYAQLERWRAMALVPRNVRRGCGRGRGSVSAVADGALDKLCAVAAGARQGSKLVMGDPLMRTYQRSPLRPGEVRSVVLSHLERAARALQAHADERMDEEDAGDARSEAAARVARNNAVPPTRELISWVASGVEPELPRRSRRARAVAFQMIASGGRDASWNYFEDGLKQAQPELTGELDADAMAAYLADGQDVLSRQMRAAIAAGADDDRLQVELEAALAQWSLPAIVDRAREADEALVIRTVRAVISISAFQGLIAIFGLAAVAGVSDAIPAPLLKFADPAHARAMMADRTYRLWTSAWPPALGTNRWLGWVAVSVGLYTVMGLTDELEAYADRLVALLYPDGPSVAVSDLLTVKQIAATASPGT